MVRLNVWALETSEYYAFYVFDMQNLGGLNFTPRNIGKSPYDGSASMGRFTDIAQCDINRPAQIGAGIIPNLSLERIP